MSVSFMGTTVPTLIFKWCPSSKAKNPRFHSPSNADTEVMKTV